MKTVEQIQAQSGVTTHGDIRVDINTAINTTNANFAEARPMVESGLVRTAQDLTEEERKQVVSNLGLTEDIRTIRAEKAIYIHSIVNIPNVSGSTNQGIVMVDYNEATGKFCAAILNGVSHTYSYYDTAPNYNPIDPNGTIGPRPGEYPQTGRIYTHNGHAFVGTEKGLAEVKMDLTPDIDFAVEPNYIPGDANLYKPFSLDSSARKINMNASACRIRVKKIYRAGDYIPGYGTVVDDGVVLFRSKRVTGHYQDPAKPKGLRDTSNRRRKYCEYARMEAHEEKNIMSFSALGVFNEFLLDKGNPIKLRNALENIYRIIIDENQNANLSPIVGYKDEIGAEGLIKWASDTINPVNKHNHHYGSIKAALARKIAYTDAYGKSRALYSPLVYGKLSLMPGCYHLGVIEKGIFMTFTKEYK